MSKPLTRAQVEELAEFFGCGIETELHMSSVGLIDFPCQNTFIIHGGKRYFIGFSNATGHYLHLWDWLTGLALHCDWSKVFQRISGVSSADLWSRPKPKP